MTYLSDNIVARNLRGFASQTRFLNTLYTMAELTGFQTASQSAIEKANASFSISRGASPFQDGVVFQITETTWKNPLVDGKVDEAHVSPVLVTTVGDLFLRSLLRDKVDVDNKPMHQRGTLIDFVRQTVNASAGKSDGEILSVILEGCKGRSIITTRVPYVAKSRDGRPYATSLVQLDFKVD